MPPISAFIAALTGGLAMWLVAGAWHEIVAATLYAETIANEHQGVGTILIAYLLLAAFMTFLIRHTRVSQNAYVTGAVIGVLTGVLWVFPHELSLAAAHGEPLGGVFLNGAWHMIEQGIGGLVIAATARLLSRSGTGAGSAA